MKSKFPRRILALTLAALTLWSVAAVMDSDTPSAAIRALQSQRLPRQFIRWELGDYFSADDLPLATVLALRQSPILLAQRSAICEAMNASDEQPSEEQKDDTTDEPAIEKSPSLPASTLSDDLEFLDNGAPSETVIPSTTKGYCVVGKAYIKNTSTKTLSKKSLAKGKFAAKLSNDGPQVLIVHTHGSEAYAMPAGHKYKSSGYYRTTDTRYNVVRVGDEIAAVLSQYGISVLHDRVLHDCPSYNAAYESSLASIQDYMKKYPSLTFVLDIHRDAIEDSSGRQYKVVSREEPHAAQLSLIMGSNHDGWEENLKLAVAVQQTILGKNPTLMRPITLRNSNYNQHLSSGSLLVEVGTAGNSLDEAIYAGRLFAQGFAETLQNGK